MSQALPLRDPLPWLLPLPSTLPAWSSLGFLLPWGTWPLGVPGPSACLAFPRRPLRMFWFRVAWPRSNSPASSSWICLNASLLLRHGPSASPSGWSSRWHVLCGALGQFPASPQLLPPPGPWRAFPHPSSWPGTQAHGGLHFNGLPVPTGKGRVVTKSL